MAFATSNIRAGSSGDRRLLTGTWSGAVGDAVGTFDVYGKVYTADFYSNITDSPSEKPLVSLSQNSSTGITTISISNNETVTDGNFRIAVSG